MLYQLTEAIWIEESRLYIRLEVDSGLQIWRPTEGEQQCEAYSAALVAPTSGQLTLALNKARATVWLT